MSTPDTDTSGLRAAIEALCDAAEKRSARRHAWLYTLDVRAALAAAPAPVSPEPGPDNTRSAD